MNTKFISDADETVSEKGIVDALLEDNPSFEWCIRVDGGWMLFQSYTDFQTWKNQK